MRAGSTEADLIELVSDMNCEMFVCLFALNMYMCVPYVAGSFGACGTCWLDRDPFDIDRSASASPIIQYSTPSCPLATAASVGHAPKWS